MESQQTNKEYTAQEKQDIFLLQNIPIKNIQVSNMGCTIAVFEKTPQEVINFLKLKGFEAHKNGVYHYLNNKEFYFIISNRRGVYFSLQINPTLIEDLNLNHLKI